MNDRFSKLQQLIAAGFDAEQAVKIVDVLLHAKPLAGTRPAPISMSASSVPVITFSAGGPPVPGSAGAMLANIAAPGGYLDKYSPRVAAAARRAAGG